MNYRVFIPCAGIGSRLGPLTAYINKSLISINNKPVISHIIEKFPIKTEFVIALGYKGDLVKQFLNLAYPKHKFLFNEVSPFEGKGSGLGFSLKSCKKDLQIPFIFISCDTIVEEKIPEPTYNWMGHARFKTTKQYRTVTIKNKTILSINEKGIKKSINDRAYIGLAGIHNYKNFWDKMDEDTSTAIITGEAHGLRALVNEKVYAHEFTWNDSGNTKALFKARNKFKKENDPNILEKSNEAIWFVGEKVIKFSDDENFIKNRVQRCKELNKYVPKIVSVKKNMYAYNLINGEVLPKIITLPLFEKLLIHSSKFWEKKKLSVYEREKFEQSCLRFYRDKTLERIQMFNQITNRSDENERINDEMSGKLKLLLDKIDWQWLSNGSPGRFHGDFHFENIIWNENESKFTFLDWRQDFAGDLYIGDIYYDLAKLLHGLIVNHEIIADNKYNIEWGGDNIKFDFYRKQILVECESYFIKWLEKNDFDVKKVLVLTALIYLNIAPLHHHPYNLLLYALGKSMLNKTMNEVF